jgi:hypothetical protein
MRRALLLIAAGLLLLPLAVLLPAGRQLFRDDPDTTLAPFVLPGSATLVLPRAGEWCLWHHSRDTLAGELFDNPPELPRALVLSVDRIRGAESNPAGLVAASSEHESSAPQSAEPGSINAATAEPVPLQFNGSASMQIQGRARATVACFTAEAGETIRVAGHLEADAAAEASPAGASALVGAVGTAPAGAGGAAGPRTPDAEPNSRAERTPDAELVSGADPIPLLSDGSGRAIADLGEVPGHSPRRLFSVRPTFFSTLRLHAAEALREALLILAGALLLLIGGIRRALRLRAESRAQAAEIARVRTAQEQSRAADTPEAHPLLEWTPPPPPPDTKP